MSKKRLIGILLASTVIFLGLWWVSIRPILETSSQSPQNKVKTAPSQPLFAVVVENSPEARPQSGLSQADFVFETLVEGGITRLLAIYRKNTVERIGPVRSARPYFVDWAWGFDAVFVHIGGSQEALQKIDNSAGQFRDLNEFYSGQYFWRDQAKAAPHNVFTSSKLILEAAQKNNWTSLAVQPSWSFDKNDSQQLSATAGDISIDFSYDAFAVNYKYDPVSNSYERFVWQKPDADSLTQKQIAPQNVVVLYVSSSLIDEKLLTLDIQTSGFGRALIFRDGGVLQARWKKDRSDAPLQLLDADNSKIALNEGQIWFEAINQEGSVVWK